VISITIFVIIYGIIKDLTFGGEWQCYSCAKEEKEEIATTIYVYKKVGGGFDKLSTQLAESFSSILK
jgi:hypothetical protein